jgi:DNA-binding protein Alba
MPPVFRLEGTISFITALIPETKVDETMSNSDSREPATRNTVYIGSQKPLMNYVLATLTCLSNSPVVILRARGAAISFAVDVALVTMNRFSSGLRVADITLGTEQLPSQEGGTRNVSSIEIKLTNSPKGQGES